VESYDFLYALISLTPGTGYPPAIEEMVGYLYDPARDPASELRKTLVGLVAWRLELFLGDEEARKKTRTLVGGLCPSECCEIVQNADDVRSLTRRSSALIC